MRGESAKGVQDRRFRPTSSLEARTRPAVLPAGPDDADPLGVTLLHVFVVRVTIGLLRTVRREAEQLRRVRRVPVMEVSTASRGPSRGSRRRRATSVSWRTVNDQFDGVARPFLAVWESGFESPQLHWFQRFADFGCPTWSLGCIGCASFGRDQAGHRTPWCFGRTSPSHAKVEVAAHAGASIHRKAERCPPVA